VNPRTFAAALVLAATIICVAAGMQQSSDPPQMSEADMMAMWAKVSTPGAPHERLEFFVGDWTYTTRMWMGGPDAPATESAGASTARSIFGGRFVMSEHEGEMMGLPMEGMGLIGFDNYKKKFTAVWLDNMSTAVMTSEGLLDQSGKVLTLFGTMDEWMTGEHDKAVKYVYRITGDDTFTFEVHDLGIVPGETKVIEIRYQRAS
jgi:hypothetical protein